MSIDETNNLILMLSSKDQSIKVLGIIIYLGIDEEIRKIIYLTWIDYLIETVYMNSNHRLKRSDYMSREMWERNVKYYAND